MSRRHLLIGGGLVTPRQLDRGVQRHALAGLYLRCTRPLDRPSAGTVTDRRERSSVSRTNRCPELVSELPFQGKHG